MRIGDAAAAAGTTPRALRFYEERGLLPSPPRTAAGQREYGQDHVARVRVIRELLALGLTVDDLCGFADRIPLLVDNPSRRCSGSEPDGPGSGVEPQAGGPRRRDRPPDPAAHPAGGADGRAEIDNCRLCDKSTLAHRPADIASPITPVLIVRRLLLSPD